MDRSNVYVVMLGRKILAVCETSEIAMRFCQDKASGSGPDAKDLSDYSVYISRFIDKNGR